MLMNESLALYVSARPQWVTCRPLPGSALYVHPMPTITDGGRVGS